MDLTDEEKEVLDALYLVWRRFLALPAQHSDDGAEFTHHIHALLAKITVRPVRRANKNNIGVWF